MQVREHLLPVVSTPDQSISYMDEPPTHTTDRAIAGRAGGPDEPPPERARVVDLVGLVVLAIVVRIPAYFADRGLTFDDGVFANSVIAMRHGGVPFRDVFSSQGPLFLPLAAMFDLVGGRNLDSPRVLAVASGVAAVVVTYLVALRVSDRLGALVAGGLIATSGALAWVTGPLAADGPALAFAALAVLLSLRLRDRPTMINAIWVGLATGAVLSTKSLEAPVLVVVVLVLLAPVASAARRRHLDTQGIARVVVAAASALVVFAAVSVPFGLADVWDQSVVYRTDAASQRDILGTARKLLSTMWDRDLALLFFAAVALGCAVVAHRRGSTDDATNDRRFAEDASWWSRNRWSSNGAAWAPSDRLLLVSWLLVTLVWLTVVVSPLWRPHVAAVSIPLALVIALYRPPLRVSLVAAALAMPMVFIQLDGLTTPGDYTGTRAELFEALGELPEGALVMSDEPGVVWRSGALSTRDLVDPSMLRRQQGRYTADSLLHDAKDPRVCAFVRYSEERFAHFADLPARLEKIGFEAVPEVGDGSVLLVKPDCLPHPL